MTGGEIRWIACDARTLRGVGGGVFRVRCSRLPRCVAGRLRRPLGQIVEYNAPGTDSAHRFSPVGWEEPVVQRPQRLGRSGPRTAGVVPGHRRFESGL